MRGSRPLAGRDRGRRRSRSCRGSSGHQPNRLQAEQRPLMGDGQWRWRVDRGRRRPWPARRQRRQTTGGWPTSPEACGLYRQDRSGAIIRLGSRTIGRIGTKDFVDASIGPRTSSFREITADDPRQPEENLRCPKAVVLTQSGDPENDFGALNGCFPVPTEPSQDAMGAED